MPMSDIQPLSGMAFNKNDKKYYCCWGILHDTTAVLFCIAIEALLALAGLGYSLKDGEINTYGIILFAYLMVYCLPIVCALVAIIRANSDLMWPIVIWTLIFIGLLFLCILLLIGCAIIYKEQISDRIPIAKDNMLKFVCITDSVMVVLAFLQFWHLYVFIKCIQYLSDKKEANVTPTLMYHNGNTRGNQRVVQMQPPAQQRRPSTQRTAQESQPQEPIVQQQFQETPDPFEQPPSFNLPSQSQPPLQKFNEPQQQFQEQSAPHRNERQLSHLQEATVQYQQDQDDLLEKQ
uniref:Uncharacterized protein n=1 Tax=Plectus sambesii TaxID=2011161 RepID=A0A914VE39_9BILA